MSDKRIQDAVQNLLADHRVTMTLKDGTVIKSQSTNSMMAYELHTWLNSFFDHEARIDIIRLKPVTWEEETIWDGHETEEYRQATTDAGPEEGSA